MSKRRGAGEGSTFQRGKRWVAQVGTGENRETGYFDTQKEANQWRHEKNEQKRNGLMFAGSKTTLSVFLAEWLIVAKSLIRPNTFLQYEQIVNQHLVPTLGRIKLKDLNPNQLQSLYTAKLASGTSSRTTIMIHAVIHRALHHALQLGLVVRNVADSVSRPKLIQKERNSLDEYQARQLLQATESHPLHLLFWMAIETGMRQGELIGLKWSDLDWQEKRLHIQRQVQRINHKLEFCEPKSAAGKRVISVGKTTIQKLRDHYNQQQDEIILAGNKWQKMDLIFSTSIGTPLEASNVLKIYKKFLKEAGLPDCTFHTLRHSCASLLLQQGVNAKVVAERLGHADVAFTLRVYSHVLMPMQAEAGEKLDELLTPIEISQELRDEKEKATKKYSSIS